MELDSTSLVNLIKDAGDLNKREIEVYDQQTGKSRNNHQHSGVTIMA